jgi:hypothetical protein
MLRIDSIRRSLATVAVAIVAALAQGCDTSILEVTDPDIILDANTRTGALALRNGVYLRLSQAVNGIQGPDAIFVFSGLITDEWRSGDTFVQRNNQDQRVFQPDNTFNATPFRALNRVRTEGSAAVRALRTYAADSLTAIASMFALSAYVETLIGELYCNGTPISGIDGPIILYGEPLTNDSVFGLAAATADTARGEATRDSARAGAAIAQADSGLDRLRLPPTATPADTARWAADTGRWRLVRTRGVATRTAAIRMQNLAAIVKGRALVNRGQFAAAAAAVASVPAAYKFHAYHSSTSSTNQVWALNNNARRYTLTNGPEGGVGIDFVGPNDPRVVRRQSTTPIFDSSVPLNVVTQGMYGEFDSIPIATGVEARLIIAEADLQAGGNRANWLTEINTLRTNTALYPPIGTGLGTGAAAHVRGPDLLALADPGNDTARVNTHFRERAFWMFSTGHRLGDMRRLLRQYGTLGFTEATVYPNGPFIKGGSYADALQMPVPLQEAGNPNFHGCLDRNP